MLLPAAVLLLSACQEEVATVAADPRPVRAITVVSGRSVSAAARMRTNDIGGSSPRASIWMAGARAGEAPSSPAPAADSSGGSKRMSQRLEYVWFAV
mgnify:CR=1 FL=1